MENYWRQQSQRMYGGTSGEEIQKLIDAQQAMQNPVQPIESGIDYALLASAMQDTGPDNYLQNPSIKSMTNQGQQLSKQSIAPESTPNIPMGNPLTEMGPSFLNEMYGFSPITEGASMADLAGSATGIDKIGAIS